MNLEPHAALLRALRRLARKRPAKKANPAQPSLPGTSAGQLKAVLDRSPTGRLVIGDEPNMQNLPGSTADKMDKYWERHPDRKPCKVSK